jgi:hypothetical protein
MALFLTERVTDFEVMYNPDAVFIYFDSVKGDTTSPDTLRVKNIQDTTKSIGVVYTKNMSSLGAWSEEEFNQGGKQTLYRGFDMIRTSLSQNHLVIFPVRVFTIIRDSSEQWVADALNKKFIEIVNTNIDNRDEFEYRAV